MTKVAIIGGGAAGMMAAATLAEREESFEVLLLEKNRELGKKVQISGGGRCNVTTGFEDLKQILKCYPRGANFFRTALYNFPPQAVATWFEQHGVPMKCEKDMRVFPISNDGDDVVGAFEAVFERSKLQVRFGCGVEGIEKKGDGFLIKMEGDELLVDKLILTPGGQAYRHTGSEGDGYKLAENLGHSVTTLGPSLNSFLVQDGWVKSLSGVSFQDVRLRMAGQEFRGPIIFTHRGMSGPAIFALSSLCAFEKINPSNPQKIRIDFCPDLDYEKLSASLQEMSANQALSKSMSKFVTKSFVLKYCDSHKLNLDKRGGEVGKKDLNKVCEILKNTEISITGRLPGDEFVTAGGIELSEVDSKTMQSRLCPGLFFAGEILNIDGFTGGYNLQVAWATGRLAGESI